MMKKTRCYMFVAILAVLIVSISTAHASAAESQISEETGNGDTGILAGGTEASTGSGEELSEDFLSYGTEDMPKQSLTGVMLRLVLSMIAIVALIYGTVYVLRYFAKKGSDKPAEDRLVQVVDRVNLDAKRSIYLVKVIDRLMVLGVGGDNVSLLGEINDESVVESVKSADFSFHLGNLFGRLNAR